jgi:hypothetical protein
MKFKTIYFLGLLCMVFMISITSACSASNNTTEGDNNGEPQETGAERVGLNFGTSPVGTSVNTLATGLASLINNHSDHIQTSVQPSAGIQAWLPLLESGEVGLGVESNPDMIWAYHGMEEFGYSNVHKEIRLILRGNFISVSGFAVREDSGIRKVEDLRGKRVAAEFPAAPNARQVSTAVLAANGLTWNDVVPVPVPSIDAGVKALQDGQVDATFALVPSSPLMQEAHSATGLYGLNFVDSVDPSNIENTPQEIIDAIHEHLPGVEMTTIEPSGYIQQEVTAIRYPVYFISSTHISDDVIYEIMEILWAHYEELHHIHPWFEQWVPEQFFEPNPQIPYHSGAIKFFTDKGLWNDEVEALHQGLLDIHGSEK